MFQWFRLKQMFQTVVSAEYEITQQTTSFDLNYMFMIADGRDSHFWMSAVFIFCFKHKLSVNVVTRFVL